MLAIYCRTSKDDREEKTIDQQVVAGKLFAQKANFPEWEIYIDPEVTGTQQDLSNRPDMMRLISDVKTKRITTVWVWEQSRLARNDLATGIILNEFKKSGTAYYIGDKKIDLNNATDTFTTKLLALFAEYERELIVSRTTRGLHTAIDKGVRGYGRFFGYKKGSKDPDTKRYTWIPVEEELSTIRRIYDLYLAGNSLRTVARTIYGEGRLTESEIRSRWTKISRFLRHIEYTGNTRDRSGKIIPCKPYPEKIVTLDEYEQVQSLLKNWGEQNALKTKYSENLCTGIISCSYCQQKFYYYLTKTSSSKKKGYEYYKHQEPPHLPKCKQMPKNLPREKVEKLTEFVYFLSLLSTSDLSLVKYELILSNAEEATKNNQMLAEMEKNLEKLKKQFARAKNLAVTSDLPPESFKEELTQLNNQIKEVTQNKDLLLKEINDETLSNQLQSHSDKRVRAYKGAGNSVRRRFLKDVLSAQVKDDIICFSTLITNRHFVFNHKADLPPIIDEVLEYAEKGENLPKEVEDYIASTFEKKIVEGFNFPVVRFVTARYFIFF